MNHPAKNPPGCILRHGHSADEVTAEAIAIRAREIAIIDGRQPNQVIEENRRS